MTTAIDPELRTKIDTACRMEEKFTKLYNEKVAKKRHQMTWLYMDNGLLVWNGNGANGKDNIQKCFQERLRFKHIMNTLVAQPIIGDAVPSQLTFIIKVSEDSEMFHLKGIDQYMDALEGDIP
ncbi:AAEL001714-PA [Aedes aegypti]|uniref:AAEL001714-PA n=2 Tax=Aedes aegypti TaxID=7159 RepID=A0A1S4EZL8_AEDAE|nr:NTF2-related export protein [Aedes aegypti]EAT47158.1 AAEL001714-PA [Aedes aegypti]